MYKCQNKASCWNSKIKVGRALAIQVVKYIEQKKSSLLLRWWVVELKCSKYHI